MENGNQLMAFLRKIPTSDGTLFAVIRMALILLATIAVARAYKSFYTKVSRQKIHQRFLHNIVKMCIYATGIVLILNQLPGFDKAFETLLAGSGIAALTIGLAAQESLGNAINGMFISMFRPFEVGDRIRLINGNITGYVEDITLRHTVIRTFINSRVIVPNSSINKDMIENSNFLDGKASSFIDVTIPYTANMELAQEIIARIIAEHPDFVDTRDPDKKDQPPVRVYVRNLGAYGVELRASMWTDNVGNNFDACSDVREQIKQAFDQAGIPFAHSAFFDPQLPGSTLESGPTPV